jgi:hypothetical protein
MNGRCMFYLLFLMDTNESWILALRYEYRMSHDVKSILPYFRGKSLQVENNEYFEI